MPAVSYTHLDVYKRQGNTTEQVQCNRIAEYAKIALERNGYEVKKDAEGTSNTAKVNSGNAWGADLYICCLLYTSIQRMERKQLRAS